MSTLLKFIHAPLNFVISIQENVLQKYFMENTDFCQLEVQILKIGGKTKTLPWSHTM